MIELLRRTARAVAIVVREGGIPRPLRGLAAFGLLPIPGPVDEAVLLAVALILFLFYRQQLRDAWVRAGNAEVESTARAKDKEKKEKREEKRVRSKKPRSG